jgi:hypothetical protein
MKYFHVDVLIVQIRDQKFIWEKLRVFVKRFVKIIDNGYSTVILRVDMDDRLEDIRCDMDD